MASGEVSSTIFGYWEPGDSEVEATIVDLETGEVILKKQIPRGDFFENVLRTGPPSQKVDDRQLALQKTQ